MVDRIAAGGMGEVFRAHDAVLDRQVAIKVLHRQLASDRGFVDRFRREARAAAGLSHPNIVNVHDWGAVDGIYYMVMEFVRGTSARDVLIEHGVLAPAQAADVLLQTLSALEHAHRQGIVHRDIKPENVMITRDGVVKVADFGLARAYADAQITEAGTVTGTVQYLSPEQLQGEPADPRTDLYALGVVAYELLTGRLPFTGETPMAIAYKHLHEKILPPSARNPAVPRSLDGWVLSMTEKQRELRPESAAEARRDLATEARSLPSAPDLATVVPEVAGIAAPAFEDDDEAGRATTVTIARVRTKNDKRRRRLRWALGLLTTLAVIAGGAYAAWFYLLPKDTVVPDVVGLTIREAERQLEEAGLLVRIARGRYSPTVVDGVVLSVSPRADMRLTEGDRVVIVPSLGHAPVEVPDLIGATLGEAKTLLREADLRPGKVSHAYSGTFDEGQVMRQSVAPEEEAPFQSEVRLVLSDGPAPVPVSDVIGTPVGPATSTLEAAGFVVRIADEHSDEVPAGKVISQEPQPDRQLQPGETVSLVVSLGPPTFPVPNVVGMTQGAAVAELEALGLRVQPIELPGATGELTVASQIPVAGNVVRVGTTVTIYVA